jgi:hypothetical protein
VFTHHRQDNVRLFVSPNRWKRGIDVDGHRSLGRATRPRAGRRELTAPSPYGAPAPQFLQGLSLPGPFSLASARLLDTIRPFPGRVERRAPTFGRREP